MKNILTSTVKSLLALSTLAILGIGCQKEVSAPENGTRNATISALMNQAAPPKGTETIVAIALGNPDFSELVEALSYVDAAPLNAGLISALNGTDQFTVFAPTNDAFNALYTDLEISDITDLPQELVAAVLKYHVTGGRRAANSVIPRTGMRTIETLLEGSTFRVDQFGTITANGIAAGVGTNYAQITDGNTSASNGIIHVINKVILP